MLRQWKPFQRRTVETKWRMREFIKWERHLTFSLLTITKETLGLGLWKLIRGYTTNVPVLIAEHYLQINNYKHGDLAKL
jgi:hypothetical protein